MQVELVIQHGQAKLITPVYLKPNAPTHVVIELNDDNLEPVRDWFAEAAGAKPKPSAKVPDASHSTMQNRFNQILGPLAKERPAASIGDDHQTLLDAYEQRLNGR